MESAFIRAYFFSAEANDLPRSGEAAGLDEIIRDVCSRGSPKEGFNQQAVLKSKRHQELVSPMVQAVMQQIFSLPSAKAMKKASDELAAAVGTLAQLRCNVILAAASLSEGNTELFEQCVRRHFLGYRKNRDWLLQAATRARAELAASLAPQSDMYEDDEDFLIGLDLCLYRFPIKAALEAAPADRKRNDGTDFERAAATTLIESDYQVRQVGASGDQGADLLATKDGLSYAIQCKDYSNNVGNAAVQQCLSAKHFYKADYAVVCANHGYTKSARELAASTGVILVTMQLLSQIDSLRKLVD